MLGPPRKSLSSPTNRYSTRFSPCYRFSRQHWPLFVAVIGLVGAAVALRLGVGLNVSRSVPRGVYRTADAPTRGALVVACLPAAVAVFGRARGYLDSGDCSGSTQPVLKSVGAVPGDVVEVDREPATVNGALRLTPPARRWTWPRGPCRTTPSNPPRPSPDREYTAGSRGCN